MLTRSSIFASRNASGRFVLPYKKAPKNISSLHTQKPVDLQFTSQFPSHNKNSGAIVILHGLFGSSRNWGAHSRTFARNLQRPVYALDLRNHGASVHAKPMTYSAMAADVIHFIQQHSLSDVSLIGHSMGGKVAMTVALNSSLHLSNLIVVDIAPARGELSNEFKDYITAMKKIEAAQVSTRKEASEILHNYEKDPNISAFLLTNLIQHPGASKFRIPVDLIGESIHELGSFPFTPEEAQWNGRTLFIKGLKSPYINRHNIPLAERFFPAMKLEHLDTNHWVHSEKPNEFSTLVQDFIRPLA
ncbi:alpha beta-hydrolase [Mycena crocata]|nr:alpha beta-hydrolase [Mycena crocata]